MSATYSIGYSWAKQLRRLEQSPVETGAVIRLEQDRGTEADVLTIAGMLRRQGLDGAADDLVRMLPSPAMLTREMVEEARQSLDTPPVTSTFRTAAENEEAGGNLRSSHAVDTPPGGG